jgi:hypothetical protein
MYEMFSTFTLFHHFIAFLDIMSQMGDAVTDANMASP